MDKTFFYTEEIDKILGMTLQTIRLLRKERKHTDSKALEQAITSIKETIDKLGDARMEIEDVEWAVPAIEENA